MNTSQEQQNALVAGTIGALLALGTAYTFQKFYSQTEQISVPEAKNKQVKMIIMRHGESKFIEWFYGWRKERKTSGLIDSKLTEE